MPNLKSMELRDLITLVSGGLAVYFWQEKQGESAQKEEIIAENEDYIESLLNDISVLEEKINPGGDAEKPPLTFSFHIKAGGLSLHQMEIYMNIRNYSKVPVEIGDFRMRLYIAGYKSETLIPSNNGSVVIPANTTSRVRLYAGDDSPYKSNYYEVRRELNRRYGTPERGTTLRMNTTILAADNPAEIDMQYLWYWNGGQQECNVFDMKGDFSYKYLGWTVGSFVGYNAGKKKDQEKNPSYWTKYDGN